MGSNRRYAQMIDAREAERLRHRPPPPLTLPRQAYGPEPLTWFTEPTAVWAWVHFREEGPARRVPAWAKGRNDRVVVVRLDGPEAWEIVVWRNAVRLRTTRV